jgi:Divergent InlB B-repeat domain
MRPFLAASGAVSFLVLACGQAGGSASTSAGPIVSVRVDGPGRILSLPPALDCPGICSASFPSGTSVTLAAAPADDAAFTRWSGDCSGASGCTFTLAKDASVVASFEPLRLDQKK